MKRERAWMQLDGRTKLFGVFGDPIGHTFSPMIHELLIEAYGANMAYAAYHVKSVHLREALQGAWAMNIQGLNLTIPHKEKAIAYLSGVDPTAGRVGAVNTLKWTPDGYYGYNTDVFGMQCQLRTNGIFLEGKEVLILGAGGAARSAVAVCQLEKAAGIRIYNRTQKRAEELARHFQQVSATNSPAIEVLNRQQLLETPHPYVIQTTPAGMLNVEARLPVEEEEFYEGILCAADVVFNPKNTPFLEKAKNCGAKTAGGLLMLFYQAVKAFEIWNEMEFDAEQTGRLQQKFLAWAEEYFHA